MRNAIRALQAMIVAGVALVLVIPAAHANVLDEIVVAHRGGATTKFGEGTMKSYKWAAANHADILDADIHWSKDSSDADTVGTIVVIHDATLDRITNCSGKVSSKLWSTISKCRTEIGGQPLIRLKDLIAEFPGKWFTVQLKQSSITNAQAKQLWNTIKGSKVQLQSSYSNRAGLNKVKSLDKADTAHKIQYALVTTGSGGTWPSVSTVKSFGPYLHAILTLPKSKMQEYKNAGIKVFLFTGKDEDDYAKMAKLDPYGVAVDDVKRFQDWRNTQA